MRSIRPAARAAVLALSLAPFSAPCRAEAASPAPTASEAPARRRPSRSEVEAVRPDFERHLPAPLLEEGPRGLLWWQWAAVPTLTAIAIAAGALLGFATRRLLARLASRALATRGGVLLGRLVGPLAAIWAIGVFTALQPWLALGGAAESALDGRDDIFRPQWRTDVAAQSFAQDLLCESVGLFFNVEQDREGGEAFQLRDRELQTRFVI